MPTFKHAGQRLSYEVYGEGSRHLVLLPGLLFPGRMHEPLASALADRGHRVITFDLLGHGESDQPRDMWRYSMPIFGARGGRAAGPPRDRRGRHRRDFTGREHHARGGLAGAFAGAGHGDRDACARQRAAGLCDRLHAAVDRPHLRRADHGTVRGRLPPGAAGAWSLPERVPGRPSRSRRPRLRSCRASSSAARRRPARSARPCRRPGSCWGTRATRSTRSRTPRCSPTSCPTGG